MFSVPRWKLPKNKLSIFDCIKLDNRDKNRNKIIKLRDILMIKAKLEIVRRLKKMYLEGNIDFLCYTTLDGALGMKLGNNMIGKNNTEYSGKSKLNFDLYGGTWKDSLFKKRRVVSWWQDY